MNLEHHLSPSVFKGHFNISYYFLNFSRPDFVCVCHISHSICSAQSSLLLLVILTIFGEAPDSTVFSSSCLFSILLFPWYLGIVSLWNCTVFTSRVMAEYEALGDWYLRKNQSSQRETCPIAAWFTPNLTLVLLALGFFSWCDSP